MPKNWETGNLHCSPMWGCNHWISHENIANTGLLLGDNFAISRPHKNQHTETQLLERLPALLSKYRSTFGNNAPPVILLYTRWTPCFRCARAIAQLRYLKYSGGQFIVAYSINVMNEFMSPIINCQSRQFLQNFAQIDVYCVKEPGENQCQEDDSIPCFQHIRYEG